MFSILDGILGYNQVLVVEYDQSKTTFCTKWGTFAYCRMSFGSIYVGGNFHRAMDVPFKGLIGQSVMVYLNDVTVYLKKRLDHP